MANCGTPPFSSLAVLQAEANFLALGGCLEDYNLDIVTNYKDIVDTAKEAPRAPSRWRSRSRSSSIPPTSGSCTGDYLGRDRPSPQPSPRKRGEGVAGARS